MVFNRKPADCAGPSPPPPFFEAYKDPKEALGGGGFRGRQLEEAVSDESALERWLQTWHGKFECFFAGLPLPSQAQLGSCLGALGLHLGSRLDAAIGR